jgi:hypothetical protein
LEELWTMSNKEKLEVRRDSRGAMVVQDLREISVLVAAPQGGIAQGQPRELAPLHDMIAQLEYLLGARP